MELEKEPIPAATVRPLPSAFATLEGVSLRLASAQGHTRQARAHRQAPFKPPGFPLLLAGIWAMAPACVDFREEMNPKVPASSNTRLLWTEPPTTASGPQPATHTHPVDAPVLLCFSDLLSPSSIDPGLVSLSSGSRNYDSEVKFDLVDWRLPQTRPCPGSLLRVFPPEALAANTRYRLRVVDRMRDWQGRPLSSQGDPRWIQRDNSRVLILEYQTDNRRIKPSERPAKPVRFSDLSTRNGVLSPQSTSCACHTQAGSFDLRDSQALYNQLRYGKQTSGQSWIQPGHPSQSYLMYKLLRTAQGHALPGVAGEPMPPSRPLRPESLALIAQWIEDGALP